MMICSLPLKSRESLAHDVINMSATHADLARERLSNVDFHKPDHDLLENC